VYIHTHRQAQLYDFMGRHYRFETGGISRGGLEGRSGSHSNVDDIYREGAKHPAVLPRGRCAERNLATVTYGLS
jgi:hypothetical protein